MCYLIIGFGSLKVRLRYSLLLEELFIPVESQFGLHKACFGLCQPGLCRVNGGHRSLFYRYIRVGFNTAKQLTLFYPIPFLHGKFNDFARNLRANFNLNLRLNFPVCRNAFRNGAEYGLLNGNLNGVGFAKPAFLFAYNGDDE